MVDPDHPLVVLAWTEIGLFRIWAIVISRMPIMGVRDGRVRLADLN